MLTLYKSLLTRLRCGALKERCCRWRNTQSLSTDQRRKTCLGALKENIIWPFRRYQGSLDLKDLFKPESYDKAHPNGANSGSSLPLVLDTHDSSADELEVIKRRSFSIARWNFLHFSVIHSPHFHRGGWSNADNRKDDDTEKTDEMHVDYVDRSQGFDVLIAKS